MNTESPMEEGPTEENPKGPEHIGETKSVKPSTEQTPIEALDLPATNDGVNEDIEMSAAKKEEMTLDNPVEQSPTEDKEDPITTNDTTADQHQENPTEPTLESAGAAKVETSEPSLEQEPTKGADVLAEEEKKDEELVQEADQLKETENIIDVESPAEQAPTDNQKDSAKENEEAEVKQSAHKENKGTPPVGEAESSGTPAKTCRNIVIAVLFLVVFGGVLLYSLGVFDSADNNTRSSASSISNGTDAAGSLNSFSPTISPSETTSVMITEYPTSSSRPSRKPTRAPTGVPSGSPSVIPTISNAPTISDAPTKAPSSQPSSRPTTSESPTIGPSSQPSNRPTLSASPSSKPTSRPSSQPTLSESPTEVPTRQPSFPPSIKPSKEPSESPSWLPTNHPTTSESPTNRPTNLPSVSPTMEPTRQPSTRPTGRPSEEPSEKPTEFPSMRPTETTVPSNRPTNLPSTSPTISDIPTTTPTVQASNGPTIAPSSRPSVSQSPTSSRTDSPSRVPTVSPTNPPTRLPTKVPTPPPTPATPRPTPAPVLPPSSMSQTEARLRNYLENDIGVAVESRNANQAVNQLVEEARADGNGLSLTPKLVQRYAMINMGLALLDGSTSGFFDPTARQNQLNWGGLNQEECSWTGITCNGNREVTDIRLLGRGLEGSIPHEVGLLQAMTQLDLASNSLVGSIPEELYNCLSLRRVYLYQNRLTGTISNKIDRLWSLDVFNLSTNRLTGPLPSTLRSSDRGIFRIRKFNVYDNQMTGTLPLDGANLRSLFYFDLGRNQFRGTIPASLAEGFVRLRHLHLDHNKFTGTLPDNIINAGDDRLQILTVNDNQLTGTLPGWHTFITQMVQFTAQNNQFTTMVHRTCKLNVLETGESPEFKSDCNVCVCGAGDLFCKHCYN